MSEELQFVILPGNRSRVNCPTSALVKTKANFSGNLWLRNEDTNRIYPGYVHRINEDLLEVFVMLNNSTMYTELELSLSPDQPNIDAENFPLVPMQLKQLNEKSIQIKKNGSLLTNFYYNDAVRPYFMPIIGPYGQPITREYPLKEIKGGSNDHIHHRSLWNAWGDVNGADNWGESMTSVPQIVKEISVLEAGYALTHIQAKVEWMDRDGEKPDLDEQRDIFIYNIMDSETIIDFRVKFTANYGDVKFGDTKEGGFISIRVADSYRGSHGGRIENALGMVAERECWGRKAPWCDYSGKVGDYVVGMAIMDHPDNYGYPTYWHVRDYGLMAANPLAISEFKNDKSLDGSLILKEKKSLEFRYRVYAHGGNAQDAAVEQKYRDFISPPEMKYLE